MIIIGSNVNAKTRTATIMHDNQRFSIELLTTKRGIVIDISHGKIVKNGTQFMIVDNQQEIFEFEKELESIELMNNG
jgi:hypothetical protein